MTNAVSPSAQLAGVRTMRASVLYDVARMEVRDVPRPEPGPADVVVRVTAIGLCGTDFHIFDGHGNYHTDRYGRPVPLTRHPQVLGHEIAGVIEETGPAVRDLKVGDAVILDQGLNCLSLGRDERCEYCTTGDSHQCEYYEEHGITGIPGGLAEFVTVPAVNVVRRSATLSDEEAALTEPLACIVHSCDGLSRAGGRYRLQGTSDRRVRTTLVCGAGPAGLLFVQYLRQVLAFDGRLIVSEPDPAKRALAERFGAETLDPRADSLAETVLERTGGRRAELVIDASGSAQVFIDLPGLLRKQGTVLLYAHGQSGADLGVLNNIQFKEPTLIAPVGASGGFDADGRPRTYREALRLLEEGRIAVGPLITHRYRSLDAVPGAFAGVHRRAGYIKGVALLGAS